MQASSRGKPVGSHVEELSRIHTLREKEVSELTHDKGARSSAQQQQMMEFLMHDADEAAMGPQLLQKEACVPGNNVLQQLVVTLSPLISPSATSSSSQSTSQPRPPTLMHTPCWA